ncbi:MAG TPA: hypothetical protein VGD76_14395 [Ramlibacter sp.]
MLKIFARPAEKPPTRAETSGRTGSPSTVGGTASRKQLLAVVLRETLIRNGVPASWLGIEFFRTMDREGARTGGIHVRLLVQDAHSAVAARMVELERDFRRRVALIDYRAHEWLQGVSWQFELPDDDGAQPTSALPRGEAARGGTLAPTQPAPL